jgi:hypothetical protein
MGPVQPGDAESPSKDLMIASTIEPMALPVDPPEPAVVDVAVPEIEDPGKGLPCDACGAPRQGIYRFVIAGATRWASISICFLCAMRCRPTGGSA